MIAVSASLALPTRFGGRYISELIEEIFMRLFDFGALAPAWLLAVGVLSRAGVAGVVADETAAFGAAIIAIGVAASRAAIGVAAMAAPYGVWDEADEARAELRM